MAVTTRHDFLAASHESLVYRGNARAMLLVRQAAASWRAANERRALAQVDPRLLADAGLERFGHSGQD